MNIEPKDTNLYSSDPVKMQMYGDLLQTQKEIERLNKKIQKLIDAGDVLYKLLDPPSEVGKFSVLHIDTSYN